MSVKKRMEFYILALQQEFQGWTHVLSIIVRLKSSLMSDELTLNFGQNHRTPLEVGTKSLKFVLIDLSV